MAGQIIFKNPEIQREYAKMHPKLRFLSSVLANLAWTLYGDVLVVTSIIRPEDQGSLHFWGLAVDFAILENGGVEGSEFLRLIMNTCFPYGLGNDGQPRETIPELRHGSAPHLHLQCKKGAQAWKNM